AGDAAGGGRGRRRPRRDLVGALAAAGGTRAGERHPQRTAARGRARRALRSRRRARLPSRPGAAAGRRGRRLRARRRSRVRGLAGAGAWGERGARAPGPGPGNGIRSEPLPAAEPAARFDPAAALASHRDLELLLDAVAGDFGRDADPAFEAWLVQALEEIEGVVPQGDGEAGTAAEGADG